MTHTAILKQYNEQTILLDTAGLLKNAEREMVQRNPFDLDFPGMATEIFLNAIFTDSSGEKDANRYLVIRPESYRLLECRYLYDWLPFTLATQAVRYGYDVVFDENPHDYMDRCNLKRQDTGFPEYNFVASFLFYQTPETLERIHYTDRNGNMHPVTGKTGLSRDLLRYLSLAKSGKTYGSCPFVTHPFDHIPVRNTCDDYDLRTKAQWKKSGYIVKENQEAFFMHPSLGNRYNLPFGIVKTHPYYLNTQVEHKKNHGKELH